MKLKFREIDKSTLMDKDKKKKMIRFALILSFNCMIMPFVLGFVIDNIIKSQPYSSYPIGFVIAVLWMLFFGKIYSKKIIKLKKENDAEGNG